MAHSTGGLLKSGELVGPWRIGDRIGQGTFSEIYAAYYNPAPSHTSASGILATIGKSGSKSGLGDSSRTRAAAKVDRPGPRVDALKWESDLLLRLQKYAFVPRHYGFLHAADGKIRVLLMQLLGNNISGIRRRQPDGSTLPFGAAVNIALQMLSAVECVHIEGFIHRDLKPSNFVHGLGRSGRKQLYVLDFGQSRMYVDDKGAVRPARQVADFRGTSLYSSLHSHQLKDLGRRDDLWSLFYCFIDMVRGGLPWRPHKDQRMKCQVAKQYYYTRPDELVVGLPGAEPLLAIQTHLQGLSFEAKPDYALIASLFKEALSQAVHSNKVTSRAYPPYPPNPALLAEWASMVHVPGKAREEGEVPAGTEAGLGIGHTGIPLAADREGDDQELVNNFDFSDMAFSCDCVLESRGGKWDSWELDSAGVPVHVALSVDAAGEPTVAAREVVARLREERDACRKLLQDTLDASDEEGTSGDDDEVTLTEASAFQANTAFESSRSGSSAALSGKKRRRPQEFDFELRSENYVVRYLADRLHNLCATDDIADENVLLTLNAFVQEWERIAKSALKQFGGYTTKETVREDVIRLMANLLAAVSGNDILSWTAPVCQEARTLIQGSGRLFSLPSESTSWDVVDNQVLIAQVEQWMASCANKPPPLVSLTSLHRSAMDDARSPEEAARDKAVRREARKRLATLTKLCSAIQREMELSKPTAGADMVLRSSSSPPLPPATSDTQASKLAAAAPLWALTSMSGPAAPLVSPPLADASRASRWTSSEPAAKPALEPKTPPIDENDMEVE